MARDAAVVSAAPGLRTPAERNGRPPVRSAPEARRRAAGVVAARRWLIGLVALLPVLAGCAAAPASSMGRRLQSISGAGKAEAFRAADRKCNDYGRAAETVAYDGAGGILTFRCIEP